MTGTKREEEAKVLVAKDEARFGALAERRFATLYGGGRLDELLQPGSGTVPCHRAGCTRRHKFTYIAILGKGYCSADCCKQEKADQEAKFERHVKDGIISREGFKECDPTYILLYKQNKAPLAKLRPQVLRLDTEYRPVFERSCRLVEDKNDGKLEAAKVYFGQKAMQFSRRLQQSTGDMAENYQGAHEAFRGAFSAVCGAAAAAGLDPERNENIVSFGFKDPVRVQHKSAAYVLAGFGSAQETPSPDDLLKLLHNHSKNTDFLRFSVTVPNDRADLLRKIYEELTKRTAEEHYVNNKLIPKAYRGEQSMYLLMNFKLSKKSHAFEVQLRFRGFHELEHKQHRVFEWLRLLRGLHDVLPGEADEYEGQMEKDGKVVEVSATPMSELVGMKAHGEGTMSFAASGSRYKGQWKHGRMHGRGTSSQVTGEFYEGQYKEGRKVGKGFTQFSDGDSYQGDYTEGRCTGVGIYRYATGAIYEGQFVNGMGEGNGTYRYTDGEVFEGQWKDDRKSGGGIMWSVDRTRTWKYTDGKKGDLVSLEEAARILRPMGFSGKPPPKS